jgi:hypothetical protein
MLFFRAPWRSLRSRNDRARFARAAEPGGSPTFHTPYNTMDGRALRGASRRRLFFVRKNSSPYENTGKGNRSSTRVRVACERWPRKDMLTRYNSRHSFLNTRRSHVYSRGHPMQSRPHGQCPRRLVRDLAASPPPAVNVRLRKSATECDTKATILPPPTHPDVRQARGDSLAAARTVTTAVIPTIGHLVSTSSSRVSDIFRSMRNFSGQSEGFRTHSGHRAPCFDILTRLRPFPVNA